MPSPHPLIPEGDLVIEMRPPLGGPNCCDFCGSTDPIVTAYGCAPFIIPEIHYQSTDEWGACAACSTIVDQGARDLLLARSLKEYARDGSVVTSTLRSLIRLVQIGFWNNKTGVATPIH